MFYNHLYSIFYSPTHTSASISRQIAAGISCEHQTLGRVEEIDLTMTPPDGDMRIRNAVAVVAAPVYGGRLAEYAVKRISMIKGIHSVAVPAVLYGNRDYEDALLELSDLLVSNGFQVAAAGAFIGEHSYSRRNMPIAAGRPDQADLAAADEFGRKAARVIRDADSSAEEDMQPIFPFPQMKGNRPYKVKSPSSPQVPVCNREICFRCGECALRCPVGAIEVFADGPVFDPSLCTKCCACFKACPAGALSFDTPYTEKLFKNCSVRREPELFF